MKLIRLDSEQRGDNCCSLIFGHQHTEETLIAGNLVRLKQIWARSS